MFETNFSGQKNWGALPPNEPLGYSFVYMNVAFVAAKLGKLV